MRIATLFSKLLNLQGLWVRGFEFDDHNDLILFVRARQRRATCPRCGKSAAIRRAGSPRRWRYLGIWGRAVWIEASVRRFRCRPCDRTVTESVPWARHDSAFTRPFVRLGNTWDEHLEGIFAFMDSLVTSARAEGINN